LPENDTEAEDQRRYEQLRRDLAAFEKWNMLPDWKRVWFGEKTREDLAHLDQLIALADNIPDLQKSIRLARATDTMSKFWRKGFMAFLGGILVLGPGLRMIGEMYEWAAAFFRKVGGP
jgi:hypothetical protein